MDEPKQIEVTLEGPQQSVYAFKCKHVVIIINGKGNSVCVLPSPMPLASAHAPAH